MNPVYIKALPVVLLIALALVPGWAKAGDEAQAAFASPDQAVDALIAANRADNEKELLKILGPQAKNLLMSGDPIADANDRKRFVAAYDAAHSLQRADDGKIVLIVGLKKWPMPIPLVHRSDGWRFDTAAGEQEILDRRIGRNEADVIEVCRAYVEAQMEYAEEHVLPDGTHEYAQQFLSRPGKHDGLYWPVGPGQPESPLGPLIASARADGYAGGGHKHQPYHGYFYRILTSQSAKASGGAVNYIANGHMIKGFALLAFPAKYGDSGIMTFMVNQDGIVQEKDLGPNTAKLAMQIKAYSPDASWKLP